MSLKLDYKDPVVKIGDFGLSITSAFPCCESLDTYQWLAPEVYSFAIHELFQSLILLFKVVSEKPQYNQSSDIFSAGVVISEILFRIYPYFIPESFRNPMVLDELFSLGYDCQEKDQYVSKVRK